MHFFFSLRNKIDEELKYLFARGVFKLVAYFQEAACTTSLLTNGDCGDCDLIVIHTLWLSLRPVSTVIPILAALVRWRSWQSLTLIQLMHNWSWMMLHRCSSSHHSLTDVLNYVPSVQNFYCPWKFPMIHEDHIFFWIPGMASFFSYISLLGLVKNEHRNTSKTFGWLW